LIIIWHLLSDRIARYHDLGAGYNTSRIDKTANPATMAARYRIDRRLPGRFQHSVTGSKPARIDIAVKAL
jgi:hypothetical protein